MPGRAAPFPTISPFSKDFLALSPRLKLPTRFFEILAPVGHPHGTHQWQTSTGARGVPRDAFSGHHTGGGNRGRGADTGATPARLLPTADFARCRAWLATLGATAGRQSAGLAGGHIGRWARWNSRARSLETGAMERHQAYTVNLSVPAEGRG